ncbi:hypothetical protein EOA75_30085 [Mesorhizobium sp. M1A.F.Ca.IN.022.07.1.1]|uniref:hypothetical protein n=1 Tax=Mesorhizobium sp. M1A.F.Ca.IN.022.07.1.1 TaxID=2496767 RepID=UPI000FC9F0A1|nr:hypothetical protein [Mesorhizobium sp. M1A.F.Ca.IN.022.07.1.1]RUV82738.1 hypothetical protein EOA75_30085 [Mesorhizobium sp. M1A.F.Ca.IN.022.07.1.1]
MTLADDIEMVRGHVSLGRRHVALQRERIVELHRLEMPTAKALEFLDLLESMQELHELHLSRLLEKAARHDAA